MTSIAILQSNYLPWKGYFDLIASVDLFVLYDCVQYTKNDWRNRNLVKDPEGTRWLTVPVRRTSLSMRIDEARVLDRSVLAKHWRTLESVYGGAPGFAQARDRVEPLFADQAPELLSELNAQLIRSFCGILGIDTPIVDSSAFTLSGDRNQRLVDICRQARADRYVSGPAARDYLDTDLFADAGVRVEWMTYDGYPEYDQPHPPFSHQVSIVDLVLCTGDAAPAFVRGKGPQ